MSEPGKMEEDHAKDGNLYQSPRKDEIGLDSDILPQELREFTLAEIKRSVVEAGRSHEALASGSSLKIFITNQIIFVDRDKNTNNFLYTYHVHQAYTR